MALAGLINRTQVGPDMPMDARYLVRLPLLVLRRVLPEQPWADALAALEAELPPDLGQTWSLGEGGTAVEGRFLLTEEGMAAADCDDCDGDGEFQHGSHTYECKACDGEGKANRPEPDSILAVAVVSHDGRILELNRYH